ncbi:uncharacterized protein cubi_02548 [Cryptosporidium ubiquitum]|uniref:Uncharacterized protein n=1 Tax=Cryptosporidium ubiquitum TaxID=857276 RepID=A0A1J4MGK5_9CRYT|nr:uncharacterized protein cubi_02548 [Cryptosporidium ubiquitum]OII73336.1 hypothetical protein cubi_02548 [Cryptosporidium ubiquitum]
MNGGFGGRNHNISDNNLNYSLPNNSIQPQYISGSSNRIDGIQEASNLPNLRLNFMGNEGSDHIEHQLRTNNGVLNGSHSINQKVNQGSFGQNIYDMKRSIPGQMGAKSLASLRVGVNQPQGINHNQQAGIQYGDIQPDGNPSTSIGAIQESNMPSYNMEMGYRGSSSSGNIGSQSIQNHLDSSANTQYMDIHGISVQNSYLNSQSQPRSVSQTRSLSHSRTQSQPRPMVQHQQQHRYQQQQKQKQQVQHQNQHLSSQEYFHSHQQYIQGFPQSHSQSQTQIQNQTQTQTQTQTQMHSQSQMHSQTQILSQTQSRPFTQSQTLKNTQTQYYSHSQPNNTQQSFSNPMTHPLVHPYSQTNPGIQSISQKSSAELSKTQRHSSSSSNLHSNLGTVQASHIQQNFQNFSSSNISQRQVDNGLKNANRGIINGPHVLYNKAEETGTTGGVTQYRSKPYSQQNHKYASQQQVNSSSSVIHPNYVQSYSQGSSSNINGVGEIESKSISQHTSNIGYKTRSIDLGVCSFQVNVPNNISDDLRNSIIRLVPKEQLNSVFFLVSSLISKSIQFRDFHARLTAILRSSQLVEILENMLREYFQQNASSSLFKQSGVNQKVLPDSRSQISHPNISQASGGRSDYFTISQSQYSSGINSNSQIYDGTLFGSMISHSHSKKSISRHGGHYNMHAKEDILLQMLKHARSKSATGLIGIDITGPSSYLTKLISNQNIQNKCMVLEEESISPETLNIWSEKLNSYGRYLLSCDGSLNLKFENSNKVSGTSRLGRVVKFGTQPDLEKSVFSTQAVKTVYKLASFYIRDILKFILDEENKSNKELNDQDFEEEGIDEEEGQQKQREKKNLPVNGNFAENGKIIEHNQIDNLKDISFNDKDSNTKSSNSCNFGMGKSIGGKGLGMKLTLSGNVSSVKPVMITSLWSCIYKSLRYNMNRYNACEPNAFHNIIIQNRSGHSRDQCSNYILIPESMYRCVESWLLSNAYNQWDKLTIL